VHTARSLHNINGDAVTDSVPDSGAES